MKKLVAFAVLLSLLACPSASAVSINVVRDRASPNAVYSLYLDVMGESIDSIDMELRSFWPHSSALLNPDSGLNGFDPRGPGEEFTFINPLLGAQAGPGAQGWSLVRHEATADGIHLAGGPLGSTIETPPSPGLFLANYVLPPVSCAIIDLTLFSDRQIVHEISGVIPLCPEPTAMSLAMLSLVGLAGVRRRSGDYRPYLRSLSSRNQCGLDSAWAAEN